ncbi:unnamed protein product [Spirodela intermedia]|uniref:Uncharacterized protein n=1 Tax=Spirodela intermedia TaxID=51605 RepID=A0A7I8INZ7_SPIIN|nr:unnamed protein product [Spirodela intermedia]CAA6659193.1 unnamed protein product [Spirodela intermedia]
MLVYEHVPGGILFNFLHPEDQQQRRRSLKANGVDCLTMEEVATALHLLRASREHPWAPPYSLEAERLLGQREPMAYETSDLGTPLSDTRLENRGRKVELST